MVPLSSYIMLSLILFAIGVFGILTTRNMIRILMGVEILLNSANLNFIAFSRYMGDITGNVFVLFTIIIAAAEAAVGLAIVMMIYRNYLTLNVGKIKEMRW